MMPSLETDTTSWAATHPGAVRTLNEDNLLSRPALGLWAVADGAGGHSSGELASAMIVAQLAALAGPLALPERAVQVQTCLDQVHNSLREVAAARGPEVVIASTFAALLVQNGQFICLWAGDSRIYQLRHGVLTQLTKDHSLVQELVDLGKLSPAEAEHHPHANVITRAVGAEGQKFALESLAGTTQKGDRFLLCSDGLSKTLAFADIARLLGGPGAAKADRLIEAALAAQVRDNVTAVVVEILR